MTKPILLLCFLILLACDNDFDLQAPFQDIPVAYAFLNPQANDNYVRVQRAFVQDGAGATAAARDPDRLYYGPDEATITLTVNETNQTAILERIDGADVNLDRQPGTFATEPNVLYRIPSEELDLRPGQAVTLSIERPEQTAATATTTLLEAIDIVRPRNIVRIDEYARPLRINWTHGDNAALFDVRLVYRIREFPRGGGEERFRTLEQTVADAVTANDRANNQVTLEVDPEDIYRFIGETLTADDRILRVFDGFDVRVTAAGEEALDRLTLESANTGITSSQALPRYSNVSGGLGLVTSRVTATKTGIELDGRSQDSLRSGFYTGDLGFQ